MHFKPDLLATPVIPVLSRVRLNFKFKVSLDNNARPSQKDKSNERPNFKCSSQDTFYAIRKKPMCSIQ